MSTRVKVRKAVPADADAIAGFNVAMALETEGKKLDPGKIVPGVKSLFDKPEYGFYVVAEVGGAVSGCLMITYEWSDWRNGVFWWIQSVYVRPECRRQGLYRAMLSFVRDIATSSPEVCGFRLYVEKDNAVARKTYESLGMRETHYRIFEEIVSVKLGV